MSANAELGAKDPEERRRRILAAAVDVLIERGFSGTRVADIAKAAGTSPALIVYHFGTLDGLLVEAITSIEDSFYSDFAAQLPPDAGAPERLRLTGVLGSDAGPAVGNWVLWMEVWVRALRDARTREIRQATDARWRGHIRDTIERGVAEGVFTCSDPEGAAVRLVAVMDGLAVQVSLGDTTVPVERMAELWLTAAANEVGLAPDSLL